ncbi:protein MAIN-LIKE 1-like [Camellia sinensis]|uniref:protein MAIN-LIKE 1-like n=1 Tax=Camellia sinensis TaxID=4442 RepID=UPI001036F307|nr:protein MAIN-LIKE 1-like [Camellia sinensis]
MDVGPSERRSVTASNRRLRELERRGRGCGRGRARVHDDDMHIAMDDDPIHGAPVMDDIAMDDDPIGDGANIVDEDILTQPFPEDPTGPSIFKSFKSHVAAAIWNGLAQLARCTYRLVNKIVVSSFVERWQPEINTFHLTVGEMTITLDDVATILGLPIVGKSISVCKLSERQAVTLVVNTLEIDEQEDRHEMSTAGDNSVRLEWLRAQFHNVTDNDSMERIACAGRAYLLFFLGCTLFSDKTCTRVPVVYLSLLSDLTTVSSYAWGAASLAYLYRQLGYASRSDVKQIAGYMTLLEGWIYEHFRGFRPHLNMNYTQDMPYVYRWTYRRECGEETQLQAFREELDRLGIHDVIWDPYQSCRDVHPCHPVTFYHSCLKCLEVVGPYHPDRVLRQFSRVQTIPNPPLGPMCASRRATAPRYNVMYAYLDIILEAWDNHVLSDRRRSTPVRQPWDCVPGYMDWYQTITHMHVQNTSCRSQVDPNIHHYQYPSQYTQRMSQIHQITHPFIEACYEDSVQHPDRLYYAIDAIEQLLQDQHISEAAPSTFTQGRSAPSSSAAHRFGAHYTRRSHS